MFVAGLPASVVVVAGISNEVCRLMNKTFDWSWLGLQGDMTQATTSTNKKA
jgi:hypothetical protein